MPSDSKGVSEGVIFVKQRPSAYQEAYKGTPGRRTATARMPVMRDLRPSLPLTTNYAESFLGIQQVGPSSPQLKI
jgi:hypothetical protein